MIDILVILLLVALLFMALLWPINWLARLFQAERSGYGPVAVAIGASLVIGLLIQIFLSTVVDWPIILAANLVIDAAIFTLLLGVSITAGAIITLVENLLGAVLMVIAIIALSAMGVGGTLVTDGIMLMNSDDVQKSSIESYADAVCDCDRDKACLHDRFAELVFMASQADDQSPGSEAHRQTLRARLCVNSGSREQNQSDPENDPDNSTPAPVASNGNETGSGAATAATPPPPTLTLPAATAQAPQSTPTAAPIPPPTTPDPAVAPVPTATPPTASTTPANPAAPPISIAQPRRARWTYTEVPLTNIDSYINKQVRISRKDNGRIVSGTLSRSKRGNAIALEQQRYGGVFVMYIPKAQIRTVEIRTLTAR